MSSSTLLFAENHHETNASEFSNPIYLIAYQQRNKEWFTLFLKHMEFSANISNIICTDLEAQQLLYASGETHMKKYRYPYYCFKYLDIDNIFPHDITLIMSSWSFKEKSLDKIWSTKVTLHEVLKAYCDKYHSNDNDCNFYLLSYHLGIANERIEFLTKHINCSNDQPQYDKTWVFKEQIHGGTGIHIINNHQEIYRLIVANASETIDCPFNPIRKKKYFSKLHKFSNYYKVNVADGTGYVINRKQCLIQQFVSNPLLVSMLPNKNIKHVFHIRSYLFVVSYENPMIVLHWPRPILMINPHEYNNKQKKLSNKVIVTNRNEMRKHNITDDSYYWVWGRTQFQSYLDKTYGVEYDFTANKFNNDIKHIATNVFRAAMYNNKLRKHTIFEKQNEFHIDILCMDIIMNDKLELSLMEVNSFCLEFCEKDKIEKKIINGGYDWDCDNYYAEMVAVTSEILKKKVTNQKIEKIESLLKFEIAFWQ